MGSLTRPAAFFVLVTMVLAAFVRQAGTPLSGGDPFMESELARLYGSWPPISYSPAPDG